MPEGPELWILCQALRSIGMTCESYGKHLLCGGNDYHFGLMGRLNVEDGSKLKHMPAAGYPHLSGKVQECSGGLHELAVRNKLGIDWMTGSVSDIKECIQRISSSKKMLGPWMLSQVDICGVGVAWASEIMSACSLLPNVPCNAQDLRDLPDMYITFRDKIMSDYLCLLHTSDPLHFIKNWYKNLYAHRCMDVYEKGTSIMVSGRRYWT
jgi:formamidopyrimidine-DNA glycosylase